MIPVKQDHCVPAPAPVVATVPAPDWSMLQQTCAFCPSLWSGIEHDMPGDRRPLPRDGSIPCKAATVPTV